MPLSGDELTQMMGAGSLGEIRQGPDGNLYEWVQGVDGLGNPIGFWKALRRIRRGVRGFVRQAMPIVQQVAPLLPGGAAVAAGLRVATPFLRQAGVADYDGIGALYEASDGSLYQVQGLQEDEAIRGLESDDEIHGFAAHQDIEGLEDTDIFRGPGETEFQGLGGYVQPDGVGEVGSYVREESPQTRWSASPRQAPEIWRPLW